MNTAPRAGPGDRNTGNVARVIADPSRSDDARETLMTVLPLRDPHAPTTRGAAA